MANERPPDKQLDPDRFVGTQFAVGCVVLVIAFLMLSAAVYWFWSR